MPTLRPLIRRITPELRQGASTALVVLASLLLVAAVVAGYARSAVLDREQFAGRATAALRDPSVRTVVADGVTDRVVLRADPDLLAARPLIVSAVSGLVGGGAFASLFHRAALDAHGAVFSHDENTVTLTLVDVGTVTGAALQRIRPDLAASLERGGRITLLQSRIGGATGDLARFAQRLRLLAALLAAATLAAAAGAVAISGHRRRAVKALGLGMMGAGVFVVVAYVIARAIVLDQFTDPDARAAAAGVWSAFLSDLRTLGFVTAGAGAMLAASAASLIHPVALEETLRRAWRIAASEPRKTWPRLGRAAGLIAAGVLVIAEPLAALEVAATLAGACLVYLGLASVLSVVELPRDAPEATYPHPRLHPRRWLSWLAGPRARHAALPALALLVAAAGLSAFFAGGGASAPALAITRCNGHAELCDRPLDEVVLPATHNAMSAPLPGWASAEQDRPIAGQLQDGIRGLLLDTHYADKLADGRVRTDLGTPAQLRASTGQDGLSDQAVQAALRLRERLGYRGGGTRGIYLCHTFCELGATPLSTGLKDIHSFLATHPDEVVVVINQDYVTPKDIVRAVGDAGLAPYVARPPASGRWPTLRQMIESGRRLVLLAENHAGAAPWYQLAYRRLTEETPYTFGSATALTAPAGLAASCRPNRGPARAPLFLVNHWVSTDPFPRPSDAAKVNAYGPLLRRAQTCERVRHHLPNLLAVNFYKRGDLFRVVDTLNRVG